MSTEQSSKPTETPWRNDLPGWTKRAKSLLTGEPSTTTPSSVPTCAADCETASVREWADPIIEEIFNALDDLDPADAETRETVISVFRDTQSVNDTHEFQKLKVRYNEAMGLLSEKLAERSASKNAGDTISAPTETEEENSLQITQRQGSVPTVPSQG